MEKITAGFKQERVSTNKSEAIFIAQNEWVQRQVAAGSTRQDLKDIAQEAADNVGRMQPAFDEIKKKVSEKVAARTISFEPSKAYAERLLKMKEEEISTLIKIGPTAENIATLRSLLKQVEDVIEARALWQAENEATKTPHIPQTATKISSEQEFLKRLKDCVQGITKESLNESILKGQFNLVNQIVERVIFDYLAKQHENAIHAQKLKNRIDEWESLIGAQPAAAKTPKVVRTRPSPIAQPAAANPPKVNAGAPSSGPKPAAANTPQVNTAAPSIGPKPEAKRPSTLLGLFIHAANALKYLGTHCLPHDKTPSSSTSSVHTNHS